MSSSSINNPDVNKLTNLSNSSLNYNSNSASTSSDTNPTNSTSNSTNAQTLINQIKQEINSLPETDDSTTSLALNTIEVLANEVSNLQKLEKLLSNKTFHKLQLNTFLKI